MKLSLSLLAYHCRQWKSWRIYAYLVAKGLIHDHQYSQNILVYCDFQENFQDLIFIILPIYLYDLVTEALKPLSQNYIKISLVYSMFLIILRCLGSLGLECSVPISGMTFMSQSMFWSLTPEAKPYYSEVLHFHHTIDFWHLVIDSFLQNYDSNSKVFQSSY